MKRELDFPDWEVYSFRGEDIPNRRHMLFSYKDDVALWYQRRHERPDELVKRTNDQMDQWFQIANRYSRNVGIDLLATHTYFVVFEGPSKNYLGEVAP